MDETTVTQILFQDIASNLATFQLAGMAVSSLLALIGVVLAARAGTALSEARHLYGQVIQAEKSLQLHRDTSGFIPNPAVARTTAFRAKTPSQEKKRSPRQNHRRR